MCGWWYLHPKALLSGPPSCWGLLLIPCSGQASGREFKIFHDGNGDTTGRTSAVPGCASSSESTWMSTRQHQKHKLSNYVQRENNRVCSQTHTHRTPHHSARLKKTDWLSGKCQAESQGVFHPLTMGWSQTLWCGGGVGGEVPGPGANSAVVGGAPAVQDLAEQQDGTRARKGKASLMSLNEVFSKITC